MTTSLKQKLTIPLVGLLILMIIGIIIFFYFDKYLSRPVQITNIKIDTKAALKLNALKQISKKNGIKEWELKAASATLLKDKNQAVLIDVSVIFFTKDNKKVHLTSQKGNLNTKTHDMTFSDKVVVTYETSTLRTDKLHYNKKKHIITSDTHVRLEKKNSVIEADSMTTRLNESTTILKGHVKGKFSENFNIL
ncbi:MAG: LPS export ABC transporter periplasmic protein LptC [Deltaproteobacteria bacterium]|nr:MAG: LPS export ABC transporter periplasmic protein LptC [Deltaproteobacteria bacterium]RLC22419.1 MAG: LPS export ABC transporter periplasmic protein LptC [Deltaproteobacteria bacterium]